MASRTDNAETKDHQPGDFSADITEPGNAKPEVVGREVIAPDSYSSGNYSTGKRGTGDERNGERQETSWEFEFSN